MRKPSHQKNKREQKKNLKILTKKDNTTVLHKKMRFKKTKKKFTKMMKY